MKKKNKKFSVAILALLGLSLASQSAFADSPYGMDYTGGEPLSSENVQIDPDLVNSLTELVDLPNAEIAFSDSELWQHGYFLNNGTCYQASYVTLTPGSPITNPENLYFIIHNDDYKIKVQFNHIIVENTLGVPDDTVAAIAVANHDKFIQPRYTFFSDAACEQNPINGITKIHSIGKMFVETNITLYDKEDNLVSSPDNLYFGILDIDGAQSFKILNNDNTLSRNNMFAKSAESLQPTSGSKKNMFVSNGYIYSDGFFTIASDGDIYVKINSSTQQEGLDLVYGFKNPAGSAANYYALQYTVVYASDEHGKISGSTDTERIISGLTPHGSEAAAKEGYEFKHWTADKDIELKNGTAIKAGKPISSDQLKQVIVNEDLTFTAHHEAKEAEPSDENEPVAPGESETPSDKPTNDKDITVPNTSADKPDTKETEKKSSVKSPDTGASTKDHGYIVAFLSALPLLAGIVAGTRYYIKTHRSIKLD